MGLIAGEGQYICVCWKLATFPAFWMYENCKVQRHKGPLVVNLWSQRVIYMMTRSIRVMMLSGPLCRRMGSACLGHSRIQVISIFEPFSILSVFTKRWVVCCWLRLINIARNTSHKIVRVLSTSTRVVCIMHRWSFSVLSANTNPFERPRIVAPAWKRGARMFSCIFISVLLRSH